MVELTRRALLGAGVATAGVVALGVGLPDAAKAAGTNATSAHPRSTRSAPLRADYEQHIGRVFTAERDGRTVRVRLTAVSAIAHGSARTRPYNFILIMKPVGAHHLHDGIYTVRRRGARTHRLFMSSVGTDRSMQSVVNRMH
jgi:hypothetical protein